jgi:hypothetical protein
LVSIDCAPARHFHERIDVDDALIDRRTPDVLRDDYFGVVDAEIGDDRAVDDVLAG